MPAQPQSHHRQPCQLASLSVFMPVHRVSARLFQVFHPHHLPADWSVCRSKSPPAQRAQWSLFWVAKLSGLTAPTGPTSLPDRGECLDRQILATMSVKNDVCVCIVLIRARACPQAPRCFIETHCSEGRVCWGEDFSCHTACLLGKGDGSKVDGEVGKCGVFGFNQRASVITQLRLANTHMIRQDLKCTLSSFFSCGLQEWDF